MRSGAGSVGDATAGVGAAGVGDAGGAGGGIAVVLQPASSSVAPRLLSFLAKTANGRTRTMWLIVLEALAALALLLGIVWWTMFSGRRGGERADDDER